MPTASPMDSPKGQGGSCGVRSDLGEQDKHEGGAGLTGSWHVTSAMNSVVLSMEPGGQVLVLLLESGSFSMARTTGKTLPGGVCQPPPNAGG